MTNITREQIEEIRGYLKDTIMDDRLCNSAFIGIVDDILDLALRALDTPSKEEIEAKAYERAADACFEMSDIYKTQEKAELFVSLLEQAACVSCAAAIRALSPSTKRYVELPEGHVVVPVEPIKERVDAAVKIALSHTVTNWPEYMIKLYRAMIREVK